MDKIKKIDLWIIGQFERLSMFIEKNIGINNIFFSRLFMSIVVILAAFNGVFYKDWFDVFIRLPMCAYLYYYSELLSRQSRKSGAKFGNQMKHESFWMSLRILMFLIFTFSFIPPIKTSPDLYRYEFLCMWILYNFLACEVDPPGVSRLKQWINSFSQKPAMQEN
jgi:hypothetical protein